MYLFRNLLTLTSGLLLVLQVHAGALEKDLIAGQFTDVGTVKVTDDGNEICVQLFTDDPYALQAVHIEVVGDPSDFPANKKGLPKIGRFSINESLNPSQSSYANCFSMADLGLNPGDMAFVAAHAEVVELGFDPISGDDLAMATLPSEVQITPIRPGNSGDPSYFDINILDSDLMGLYDGWCVDTSRTINPGSTYTADVYSTYDVDSYPDTMVDMPENLDLVNWLVNQGVVGQSSACGGNYTFGDVQRAIWQLIDDNDSTAGLGPWSQCRADELENAARAMGENFVPQCGQTVAIVLKPFSGNGSLRQILIHQILVAELPLLCEPMIIGEETAWGDGINGTPFNPKKSWSKYFKYTIMQ